WDDPQGERRWDPRHQDPGEGPRSKYAGGHRIRVTPVPIPNTEVKPDTADGTAWETVWESRSLPAVIMEESRREKSCRLFFIRNKGEGFPRGFPCQRSAAKPPARRAAPSRKQSHCMGSVVWESRSLPAVIMEKRPT